jgi:hypothetical protein
MAQEVADGSNDLEQLQRRFEESRTLRTSRGRLPQASSEEAAEAAKRYGLNSTAQVLPLDYSRLNKHIAAKADPVKRKKNMGARPEFVELIAPSPGGTTDCHIEVESSGGAKVRIELKGTPRANWQT